LDAAKNESGIPDLWEKWENSSRAEKTQLVNEALNGKRDNLPSEVMTRFQILRTQYPAILGTMERKDRIKLYVNAIDSYIAEQKSNLNKNLKPSALPFGIGGVGLGFAYLFSKDDRNSGGAGIFGLKIHVPGSDFEAFIPHPREKERLQQLLSAGEIRMQMDKWLGGEKIPAFTEKTSDIYYKPGSNLGIGRKAGEDEEATFQTSGKGLKTDIDAYNEALKDAEITLKYDKDQKRTKITIGRDKDRNIEVHIDPLLKNLGLIVDGDELYLKGNMDNMLITRQKFEFPFPFDRTDRAAGSDARQTNLLDVITIRTADSVAGQRNLDTIEELESGFVEKRQGGKFTMQPGANPNAKSSLLDYATVRAEENVDRYNELRRQEEELRAETPEHMNNSIDQNTLAEFDANRNRAHKAIDIPATFDNLKRLTPEMRDFFYKEVFNQKTNPTFYNSFAQLTEMSEDIVVADKLAQDWTKQVGSKKPANVPAELGSQQLQELMSLINAKWWKMLYPHKWGDDKLETEDLNKERTAQLDNGIAEQIVLEPGCFITHEFQVQGKGLEHLKVKITNKRDVIIVDTEKHVAFQAANYKLTTENSWEVIPLGKAEEVQGLPKYQEVLRQCSAAIKEQDSDNKAINEKMSVALEARIKFTKERLEKEFKKTAGTLETAYGITLDNDPKVLAEKFITDVYSRLRTILKRQPPVDFRSLGYQELLEGSTLMSASRETKFNKAGAQVERSTPSQSRIIGYQNMDAEEGVVHGYGFLSITEHDYSKALAYTKEDLKNPEKKKEQELAMVLLEIASPGGLQRKIEKPEEILDASKDEEGKAKEWKEFFSSPFAMKVYGIDARQLMFGQENYNKVTDIMEAINAKPYSAENIVKAIEGNKDALLEFVNLTNNLRKAQSRQEPFEKGLYTHKYPKTGIIVEINMFNDTKILGGAFTKCTNPSFAVKDGIEVKVYSPIQTKGFTNKTTMVVDSELTRIFTYVDLMGAVTYDGQEKKTPPDNAKDLGAGTKIEAASEPGATNSNQIRIETPAGEQVQVTDNPGGTGL
jgi:hypothetical protein